MVISFLRQRTFRTISTEKNLTWEHLCCFCKQPIIDGNPFLIMALDKPALIGICHAGCSYNEYYCARFPLCPPDYLSGENISFLVQFYPRLFNLPNWESPNSALRRCLASILLEYPQSILDPLFTFQQFQKNHFKYLRCYRGDIEEDYLSFLGQVQKDTQKHPLKLEVNFQK